MGFGKFFKKIRGFAAPLAGLALGPAGLGLSALAAGAAGAGIGALGGGGIKGALGGGLGAYGAAGGAGALGGALSKTAGLGLGNAAATALGGGLLGAASGGITNGTKGALIGGAVGGGAGYVQGSGGFGNALKNVTGTGSAATGAGGAASSYISDTGTNAYSALDSNDVYNLRPLATDSSIVSSIPKTATTAAPAATSGGWATPLLSAGVGTFANQRAQDQLLEGQENAANTLSPFLNSSFDASNLESDPGYQFQLAQGNKALDRAAAARGGYFSGQALTDAQDYGQGLAATTLQDAFTRYNSDQNRKIGIAGGLADIAANQGNVRANATTNLGNIATGTLAAGLGGNGINSQGQIVNTNSQIDPRLLAYYRAQGLA